jgi:preprotein translocase subunit SecF
VQLIKPDVHIDFLSKVKFAGMLSLLLIVVSAGSLLIKGGPKYGIDFSGGTLIQVKFDRDAAIRTPQIRDALAGLGVQEVSIQPFGDKYENEYLINIQKSASDLAGLSDRVADLFAETFGAENFEIRRVEMVGPVVGKSLRQKGILAVICSLLGMLAYIWIRFELRFGIGAIVALTHDVIITLGALSITNTAIDLPIIAALLTVVGYSVNDTIIVCDRIRENRRRMIREKLENIINISINNTLSRTLMTSLTTLLVVITLFLFGGGVIHDFAFTLLVGVLIGTYSSIFIASPLLLFWERFFHDKKGAGAKKGARA